jgi:hypothetical protein
MFFFKINGIATKTPSSCEWSVEDVSSEESGRTLSGKMEKDIVAQKRTLKVKWSAMSWKEASQIVNLCKNQGVKVSVTYPDIMAGGMITKDFYTGSCSAPYLFWTNDQQMVGGISCNFIEI